MQETKTKEEVIGWLCSMPINGKPMAKEKAHAIWDQITSQPCMLCFKKSDIFATYVPDPKSAENFGSIKNKQRMIFYALCSECAILPDATEKVEEKLLVQFKKYN